MNGPFKKNAGHGLNGSRRRSHSIEQSSGAGGGAAASSSGGGRKTNGKGHGIQEEREEEEESEKRLELVELENGTFPVCLCLSCLTALRRRRRVPDSALNFFFLIQNSPIESAAQNVASADDGDAFVD